MWKYSSFILRDFFLGALLAVLGWVNPRRTSKFPLGGARDIGGEGSRAPPNHAAKKPRGRRPLAQARILIARYSWTPRANFPHQPFFEREIFTFFSKVFKINSKTSWKLPHLSSPQLQVNNWENAANYRPQNIQSKSFFPQFVKNDTLSNHVHHVWRYLNSKAYLWLTATKLFFLFHITLIFFIFNTLSIMYYDTY